MKPLPKKLQSKIDDLVDNDGVDVPEKIANHLLQVIRLQREALEKISCNHKNAGKTDKQVVPCCIAREALTQSKEILGDDE